MNSQRISAPVESATLPDSTAVLPEHPPLMNQLSLVLRLIAIAAALVVVTFYFRGGNQLADTGQLLTQSESRNTELNANLAKAEQQKTEFRERVQHMTLEIENLTRDLRLRESEVLLVRQELAQVRAKLEEAQSSNTTLLSQNESFHREVIELKAQGIDPKRDPRQLTAQIETHRARIRELEAQIDDAHTVIRGLFLSTPSNRPDLSAISTGRTRIHRLEPQHRLLVLEVGRQEDISETQTLQLSRDGVPLSTVTVKAVAENFCVVQLPWVDSKILPDLQEGIEIDYRH